jgi:hypothetical protein
VGHFYEINRVTFGLTNINEGDVHAPQWPYSLQVCYYRLTPAFKLRPAGHDYDKTGAVTLPRCVCWMCCFWFVLLGQGSWRVL